MFVGTFKFYKMTATPTSLWLAVFHTEDLGVVGLHLQDLLQAVEVVNPAGKRSHSFQAKRPRGFFPGRT